MSKDVTDPVIRAKRTFFFDNARCFCTGILEAGFKTFVLLIAIRMFHAPNFCKAVISSAGFAGLLAAPVVVSYASRLRTVPATNICGCCFLLVALTIMLSTITDQFWIYLVLIAGSRAIFKQYIPFMLDVYGNNYPKEERGYRLSHSLMLLPIATILFSAIGGYILDTGIENYRLVLILIALSAICGAYTFFKIPSRPVPECKGNDSAIANIKLIFQDKLFFTCLIIMMLTGMTIQMAVPLRAEYLANEKYGLNISNFHISLLLVTIPYLCRTISSIFWGKLFDKVSLVKIRIIVDVFVLVEVLIFFTSQTFNMFILSAVLMGIAYGGGEIVWCLWITKIVNKDQLSRYMSANTAFIGVRSFISPFIGYFLLDSGVSFPMIGCIAAALVATSIVGCLLIRNHPRFTTVYE